MAISSCSCLTRSARLPFWYSSTDSWRCLIIFCSSGSTSASPSAGLPCPRASMSAFLSVELTMRSVDTARSFLAFCASIKALLMSSRSTDHPFLWLVRIVAALADIEVLNFSEALPIEIAKITVMRRIECSVRKAALHNNYFLAFGDICIYEIVFRFTRQSITTAKAGVCWIRLRFHQPNPFVLCTLACIFGFPQ
jgi:hypothetical protein